MRTLLDVPHSETCPTRNIFKESRVTFFCGRNIIVQGVPETINTNHADYDTIEMKFIDQSLEMKNILT